MQKLFEGIASYTKILQAIQGTAFVGSAHDSAEFEALYEAWVQKNAEKIKASMAAQRKFFEEVFAMDVLCGAVLQVAAKAIECYSSNTNVPANVASLVQSGSKAIPFCIGREVRGIPIGLVIYAGRNQHMHYNEPNLSTLNKAIFNKLANISKFSSVKDPALDLANHTLSSLASNITYLLGWRSYESYLSDIHALLEI